jgi:hypothetical protein
VVRHIDNAHLSEVLAFQVQFGDSAEIDNTWELDSTAMKIRFEESA